MSVIRLSTERGVRRLSSSFCAENVATGKICNPLKEIKKSHSFLIEE